MKTETKTALIVGAVGLIIWIVFMGYVRIYHGGGYMTDWRWKANWGLQDTVVNMGEIMNMPYISVRTMHPTVVKQLEEMGMVLTEEQLKERAMQQSKQAVDEYRRRMGY